MSEWMESTVCIGGDDVTVMEAGAGRPLLVLHDELGPTSWLTWHGALARNRRLVMPIYPGFKGERIGWVRSIRDLAVLYGHLLRQSDYGTPDVVGFSLGGWIAAEMIAANPAQFGKAALVAPFGIKPDTGFIMDFFPMTAADYIQSSFHRPDAVAEFATLYGPASPEQYESWEDARTECARLAWEPYMHDPSLEFLLHGVSGLPVTLFWGDKDAVLPQSAVRAYERALPGCRLHIFKDCGHRPEVECAADFAKALSRFLE